MSGQTREELIEQADALYDAIGARVFREEFRELYVSRFEQAHTPTSDERESLATWDIDAMIEGLRSAADSPKGQVAIARQRLVEAAEAIEALAAGFRRTVQAEPTTAQDTEVEMLTVRRIIVVQPGMIFGSLDRIEVDVCVKCGAVVFDPIQHNIWHRAAEGTGQPANQTATGSPSGGPEPLEGT